MSLQDIVREQTRTILDLLRGAEKELEVHRRNQTATETRERNFTQEAAGMQPVTSEREATLRSLRIKVQELQSQVAQLQERLHERQKECDLAEGEHREVEEERRQRLKAAASARKEAEECARMVAESQKQIVEYQERLRKERDIAFEKYLEKVWTSLVKCEDEAETAGEALQALEHLNRARHDDPRVAELWEARQEWQRISQSAGPVQVRKTAGREVQRIEEEIDVRFPGALVAAARGSKLDELEEIFARPLGSGSGYVISLPVPVEICKTLDSGATSDAEDLAVRVIWGFAGGIPNTPKRKSRFAIRGNSLIMLVEETLAETQSRNPIAVRLAGGGRVSFLISELPRELQEALTDDNLDG